MSQHLLFMMKMARDWSIEVAESCPKEIAELQINKFNNTVHWQVGHILTVTERMMFNYPRHSSSLPQTFSNWFDSGTKPTEWEQSPPQLADLIILLKEQQERLLAITPEQFEQRLDPPLYSFTTYGQCAGFVAIHETLHVGKMEEMMRVTEKRYERGI